MFISTHKSEEAQVAISSQSNTAKHYTSIRSRFRNAVHFHDLHRYLRIAEPFTIAKQINFLVPNNVEETIKFKHFHFHSNEIVIDRGS